MMTRRNQRSQRGLATETQRHRVFVGSAKEDLCVSVSLWLILSVSSTLVNDDTEVSEVTERFGHGDTETPSFCWLGKRRSLCLSVSMADLVCILYALNDDTEESEV